MKVCVVGPTYPYRGGIAHYSTLLVRHLRQAGHQTNFYSYTRQYPRWLFPGSTDKDPSSTPLREDCEYILDPMNPLTWWRLCRRIRMDKPDLIVLQWWVPYWTPSLTYMSRWLQKHTRARIVYLCHNVTPHDGGGVLDRRFALAALRQGDAFIVHTDQDHHRLQALLPQAHVFRTQHPTYAELAQRGPDIDGSLMRTKLNIDPAVPVLLFFGFVRPYKGLEYLIQALPLVLKEVKVHVLVVGEFWVPKDFYERYAEEYKVADAITMVNTYIPDEELGYYFDIAEVVVLPYISASQSGVTQLAFGFGKPVIVTRVGGLSEVVRDGETGLVVPPQDEKALAQALIRYIKQNLREPFEQAIAEQEQHQEYGWHMLVQTMETINETVQSR